MTSEQDDLAALGRNAFGRLRARLQGLAEDEYGWEPAPGVSPIAWRVQHIADLLTEDRNAAWLGVPGGTAPPRATGATGAAGAAGAVAALEQAFAVWESVLSAVPEGALAGAVGPVGGAYVGSTRRALVLHVLDELVHHGAEVALVRDLWAARAAG